MLACLSYADYGPPRANQHGLSWLASPLDFPLLPVAPLCGRAFLLPVRPLCAPPSWAAGWTSPGSTARTSTHHLLLQWCRDRRPLRPSSCMQSALQFLSTFHLCKSIFTPFVQFSTSTSAPLRLLLPRRPDVAHSFVCFWPRHQRLARTIRIQKHSFVSTGQASPDESLPLNTNRSLSLSNRAIVERAPSLVTERLDTRQYIYG
jgi:hypothetical protein